uniref:Methyltransferase-like protein 5 n=1 Tax=Chrysotila carterae TaxID=13221 RepID=A0A7S4FA90_CHRCT|mmetsp:Transcript_35813/g.75281  ORF Transcript_35813/g.75281 Transcript_35813/m.75281 type:complete len:256 (+) Transcript_35813:299-1066(+)
MKLKQLVASLEQVRTWDSPKTRLEQYPTPPDLAAHLLMVAAQDEHIEGMHVADLGCGGGVLGIGAALLGAVQVVGYDVDAEALEVASENREEFEVPLDLVHCDVTKLAGSRAMQNRFDCVVMNPPFGTQPDSNGIDVAFLHAALSLCSENGAVYSLHKSSTRPFLSKTLKSWGALPEVVAELKFEIPKMYRHHTKQSVDVAVDFWKISKGSEVAELLPRELASMSVQEVANSSTGARAAQGRGHGQRKPGRGRSR